MLFFWMLDHVSIVRNCWFFSTSIYMYICQCNNIIHMFMSSHAGMYAVDFSGSNLHSPTLFRH